MPEPKTRRIPKPFWFAVAAVLMVVLAVFLQVWLPYHREQVAIREIERLGGVVRTSWGGPEWILYGPEWMIEIVDDGWLSWFDRVEAVAFSKTANSDEAMKHLTDIHSLRELYLDNAYVTDKGFRHLTGLTNLKRLNLHYSNVTEEGIKELQKALPDCQISYNLFNSHYGWRRNRMLKQ